MTVDHGIVEPLGAAESLALVLTAELGRLAFTDEHGPTVEPFAFAVEDTAIVLAAGPRSGARAAAGQTVAFEVDEIDPVHRSGWSVVAIGTLHRARPGVAADPDPWPDADDGEDRLLLEVRIDRLTGRRLRRETRRE